jgi:hypothetical protein
MMLPSPTAGSSTSSAPALTMSFLTAMRPVARLPAMIPAEMTRDHGRGGHDLALTVALSDELQCVPGAAEIVGRKPAGNGNDEIAKARAGQ